MQALKTLKKFANEADKKVWGPFFWSVLHNRAKDTISTRFLHAFIAAIPCPDCKEHFQKVTEKYPLRIFKNHATWAWFVHNRVNEEQANNPFYSLEEFKRNY